MKTIIGRKINEDLKKEPTEKKNKNNKQKQ